MQPFEKPHSHRISMRLVAAALAGAAFANMMHGHDNTSEQIFDDAQVRSIEFAAKAVDFTERDSDNSHSLALQTNLEEVLDGGEQLYRTKLPDNYSDTLSVVRFPAKTEGADYEQVGAVYDTKSGAIDIFPSSADASHDPPDAPREYDLFLRLPTGDGADEAAYSYITTISRDGKVVQATAE